MISTTLVLTATMVFWTSAGEGSAGDWPTFRGAQRTATAPDRNLLKSWPKDGPPLVWKTKGAGRGYSSPAIAAGRVYVLGDASSTAEDKDEYLVCFDQATGKQLWKTRTGPAWNEGKPTWQSSRSTPTVDGDHVYVVTPFGVLICCSTEGKEIWRKDLKKEFQGVKADGWGYSESVLVDGDRVVCTPGGPKNTMVALDKDVGRTLWTCSRKGDRGAGHASIVTAEVKGTRVYVQSTGSGAMGVAAEDGELLWTFDVEQTTAVIPTPIIQGDLVFFVAGYGRGGALLRQKPDGKGGISIQTVYDLKKDLANKHGGVVLVGHHLYGDSEDRGILWCAELKTGKILWKSRAGGKDSASLAAADGRLYVHQADGSMSLVLASPKGYKEVGRFTLPGAGERPGWAHPVIAGGRLYVREGDVLACYDLRP